MDYTCPALDSHQRLDHGRFLDPEHFNCLEDINETFDMQPLQDNVQRYEHSTATNTRTGMERERGCDEHCRTVLLGHSYVCNLFCLQAVGLSPLDTLSLNILNRCLI